MTIRGRIQLIRRLVLSFFLTACLTVTDLRITDLLVSPPGNLQLTWSAVSGLTYRVQYSSSLTGGLWSNLGSSIAATGSTARATDTMGNNSARYYRVVKHEPPSR